MPLSPPAAIGILAMLWAIGAGLMLRSLFDLAFPLPSRDYRWAPRMVLTCGLISALGLAAWFALTSTFAAALHLDSDAIARLAGLLPISAAATGAVMVARGLLRLIGQNITDMIDPTPSSWANRYPTELDLFAAHASFRAAAFDVMSDDLGAEMGATPVKSGGHDVVGISLGVILIGLAAKHWGLATLCI
jgi:hypothetical protein